MATQEEVLKAASYIIGRAAARILTSTPREAAEAAYVPGGPSLEELEAGVRRYQERAEARASCRPNSSFEEFYSPSE